MEYNQESPVKESIGNIQRDFLYGLFVIIPMVFTVWFVVFSISFISGPVSVFLGEDAPSTTKTLIMINYEKDLNSKCKWSMTPPLGHSYYSGLKKEFFLIETFT